FFQSPQYGWRSVAAWYKLTNGVIPGCGQDLFDLSFEEQTRCILSFVNDRSVAYDHVGSCLSAPPSSTTAATTTTTTQGATTTSTTMPTTTTVAAAAWHQVFLQRWLL
ncbi:unnamed protein product, partial [Symbiodinium natans]